MGKILLFLFCCQSAASTYDEDAARTYVQYARAAFCDAAVIAAWDCGSICDGLPVVRESVKYFGPGQSWQVQGYVAQLSNDPTQCVAAFRGSVNLANWLADAQLWLVQWPRDSVVDWCPGCEVHNGFAEAYEELQPQFRAAVVNLGCAKVHLAAHSLGASVATLATIDLRGSLNVDVPAPYLFGAPRVGNVAFAAAFETLAAEIPSVWRPIHHYDPVPRACLRSLGFEHVGREVYYTTEDSSTFKVCSPYTSEDPTCADSVSLASCVASPYLFDHLTYFNVSFKTADFPAGCVDNVNSSGTREFLV